MDNVKSILNEFTPITLREMDAGVELMDRMDVKYIFTFDQLPVFLSHLKDDYRVLNVLENRISKYESLYFDTEDFELFFNHHRNRPNRYKIRYRSYVESDLHFFEIKFKNGRGRTIKDRVVQGRVNQTIKNNAEEFLHEKTPLIADRLEPKFNVNYLRITLVNKTREERVTIDVDINFRKDGIDNIIEHLVIAEVKQNDPFVSPFISVMKKYRIRQGALSKYCYGVILLYEKMKHNNFKPGLILLNKIINGTITRTT